MNERVREEVSEMFLTSLHPDQCERIHEAALRILEQTGVLVQCREAREVMKKGGARVDGEKVFISPALVERALATVPHRFVLHDQTGSPRHTVGGRVCLFGAGSDCLNILDHRGGDRRDPLLRDLEELVALCDCLPNIDFLMSMVIPTDFPRSVADRIQMETMLRHSTKPIIGVSFSYEGAKDIIRMAETAAGGEESLCKNPFLIHYIQPVRALVHNEEAVQKLMLTVRKGVPALYLVSAIMGISSPISAAGYQAMGAAGQLSMLVLAQLLREGVPFVVRGGRIVVADMKTMLATFADPGNRVFSADMAHFYDLPSFGTAGCADAKLMDWQAVAEASLTLLADSLAGSNLIHDVGYVESGITFSAEMLVLCDEIISWIKAFKRGAEVNEETLALELIDQLGFSGDFLSSEHTLRHYREQWAPSLFSRDSYSHWAQRGREDTRQRVQRKIERLLAGRRPRSIPAEIERELRKISEHARAHAQESGATASS